MARPHAEPPTPVERKRGAKDVAPPAPSKASEKPRMELAQEEGPVAKAAPSSELAAQRALEPSLDAVLVLRVSDVPLAVTGLKERAARFGGREADEGSKLRDRQLHGHPGEVKSMPGGRKEEVQEEASFDLVLPRGAYPAFKTSLKEVGELSIEQEALEEGSPREMITVRVTILPTTR